MYWLVEKKGQDLLNESYLREKFEIHHLNKSKIISKQNGLSVRFLDHPFKGLILRIKPSKIDGESYTRGFIHLFNPTFSILFVLAIIFFGKALSSESSSHLSYFVLALIGILIFNYFKYKSIVKNLLRILGI